MAGIIHIYGPVLPNRGGVEGQDLKGMGEELRPLPQLPADQWSVWDGTIGKLGKVRSFPIRVSPLFLDYYTIKVQINICVYGELEDGAEIISFYGPVYPNKGGGGKDLQGVREKLRPSAPAAS